jgi:hypothetical protein
MITDSRLRLHGSDTAAAAFTTLTAAAVWYSANAMDLNVNTNVSGGTTTNQNRDIGEGEDLYAVLTVGAASTAGNGVTAEVIVSDDLAGTTNALVVGSFGAISQANLQVAGRHFVARINPQLRTVGQRYLQIRFTNGATTAQVACTLFADVVHGIYDSTKFYASGFTVT